MHKAQGTHNHFEKESFPESPHQPSEFRKFLLHESLEFIDIAKKEQFSLIYCDIILN